jgi:thioredoxin 2
MAIITCPGCGARNRVDDRAVVMRPICGRCGVDLPPAEASGAPIDVTDATFPATVLGSGARPVLVDCWAPWCPPCRALSPVIDRIAAAAGGRYVVAKLNIDENPAVTNQFGIRSIPALLIFKNGELVDQLAGAQPQQVIEQRLAAHS